MSTPPRQVTVYHPATQHSLLLARALNEAGYEATLVTRFETRSAMSQSAIVRLAYQALGQSKSMRRAVENRSVGDVPSFSTDPAGILIGRLIRQAVGPSAQLRFDRSRMQHSARAAARMMRQQLHPELVIAAETGALELLREVRAAVPVVIDVAHPHPREVDRCRQLATSRYPELTSSWDDPPFEKSGWERLNQALTRATGVWTASQYTADTIRTYVHPAIRVDVVGYGVPVMRRLSRGSAYQGRYLFVGAVGLRKGVPLLLDAWVKSGLASEGCVLDVVGRRLDPQVEGMLGRLAGVQRHVDISSDRLDRMFLAADALVSPSYCEGFGRVLIEAMAAGLPFLTTNTGAANDILGPNLKGWRVEIDDLDGFTDLLQRFHGQSSSRSDFGAAILSRRQQWSEEQYGFRLRSAVERQVGV